MLKRMFIFIVVALSSTTVFAKFDFRIVGGESATLDQAPFIVSLRDSSGNHFCGGTLINQEWVVTAAHCIVYGEKPSTVYAEFLKVNGGPNAKKLKVLDVHVHPQFDVMTPNGSDVALLKIEKFKEAKIALMNDVDVSSYANTMLQVAGWGAMQEWDYDMADDLQIVDVPFVDQAVCENQFQNEQTSKDDYLDNTMFCAGYSAGMKDACQGDSGGPIFTYDSNRQQYILVGIVSWGYGCARPNFSGVYSNVYELKSWIQETSGL